MKKEKKIKKSDLLTLEEKRTEVTLKILSCIRHTPEHYKLREELHEIERVIKGGDLVQHWIEYDGYRDMTRQELKFHLAMAKKQNDTHTIFLLLTWLNKDKEKKSDAISVNRNKYERIKCPICQSSSHRIRGSITEDRKCKNGHTFTVDDINKSATYKI